MRRLLSFVITILLFASVATLALSENTDEELSERFKTNTIEYNGVTYRPRSRIETILILGTDMREGTDPTSIHSQIQADFLMLLAIDDDRKTVTPIRINRDTMCTIPAQMLSGDFREGEGQIAIAFSSSTSLVQGCELTAQAVSNLFNGIRIDHYYSLNMDGIGALNDAIGGVTVTIPDDMTHYDPEMVQGATIKLNGQQAHYFVRSRYYIGDESNVSRMRRQRMYIEGAKLILVKKLRDNPNSFGDLYDTLQDYVTTDMSKGRIINLASKVQRYDVSDSLTLEGENIIGTFGYVEFYPDEESLMKIILSTFFDSVSQEVG